MKGNPLERIKMHPEMIDLFGMLGRGEVSVTDVRKELSNLISGYLKIFNIRQNVKNVGIIADLVVTKNFPQSTIARLYKSIAESGRLSSDISNEDSSSNDLAMGVFEIASNIKTELHETDAKQGAIVFCQFIEAAGYLPKEVREY